MKKSYLLVAIQFICIFLLFANTNIAELQGSTMLLFILGVVVGIDAVWEMKKSKLRVTPDVASGATLVTSGIYQYIRHPMYTGLLLCCLSLIIANTTQFRILIFGILVIDLLYKLTYEEQLLQKHFPTYKEYMKHTKRLIPFVY